LIKFDNVAGLTGSQFEKACVLAPIGGQFPHIDLLVNIPDRKLLLAIQVTVSTAYGHNNKSPINKFWEQHAGQWHNRLKALGVQRELIFLWVCGGVGSSSYRVPADDNKELFTSFLPGDRQKKGEKKLPWLGASIPQLQCLEKYPVKWIEKRVISAFIQEQLENL